jgi:hypothetical protein
LERLPLLADQADRLAIQAWVERSNLGVEPRLIRSAYRVEGPLEVAALRRALLAVRARHSALRSGFPGRGADGYAYIESRVVDPLDVIDLPGGSVEEAVGLVHERVSENGDLEAADVFRARLVRLGATQAVLGLSADHLVVDGQSYEIVQADLWKLYTEFSGGASADLAPVVFSHEDFVRWEKAWLASDDAERLLARAESYLDGVGANPPVLLAGTTLDHNDTYTVGNVQHALSAAAVEGLGTYGKASGKTPFAILASGLLAGISAATGRDQVGTLIPVTRRATRDMAHVASYISSYTTLPARLTGALTFDELTSQVRLAVVQALRIGQLPGPAINARLAPHMLGTLLAVPSAFFDLTEWSWQSDEATEVAGLRLHAVELPEIEGQIESFEVAATVTGEGITLDAFFPSDVYPQAVAEKFLRDWAAVVERGTAEPATAVRELTGA